MYKIVLLKGTLSYNVWAVLVFRFCLKEQASKYSSHKALLKSKYNTYKDLPDCDINQGIDWSGH